MWKKQQQEKPMIREEIDKRMQEMIAERQLQDEEARKQYLKSTGKTLFQYQKDLQEKSMTREEIDKRIQEMIAERQLQDEKARKQCFKCS